MPSAGTSTGRMTGSVTRIMARIARNSSVCLSSVGTLEPGAVATNSAAASAPAYGWSNTRAVGQSSCPPDRHWRTECRAARKTRKMMTKIATSIDASELGSFQYSTTSEA